MARIILSPSGKSIETQAGDTVLAALERAGYALPNNCRAGACGECKVKVLSGSFDQGLVLDMALSREEREAGYGLMCMAKPQTDEMVIEWGTADAKPRLFPPEKGQPYIVVEKLRRTPRIVELRMRPLGAPMRFWPGQYVMLGDRAAGAPQRCYSIANVPRPDGEITVQVTNVAQGVTSRWIHETLEAGSRISLDGPYGTFIGDPSVETPVLCMAAGTGLAPILALTEAALRRNYRNAVTLLFSARTAEDVYMGGLVSYWATKHRNFTFLTTLTRDRRKGHLSGRIPAILPDLFPDLSGHSVFIAGSPGFVDNCVKAARAAGAAESHIHLEGFVGQALPEVPDREHLVRELVLPVL